MIVALLPVTSVFTGFIRQRLFVYVMIMTLFLTGFGGGVISALFLPAGVETELKTFLKESVERVSDLTYMSETDPRISGPFADELAPILAKHVGLPWLFAMTVVGVPIVFGMQFLHGYALGFTASLFVKQWSVWGVLYAFSGVLPHQLFIATGEWIVTGAAISYAVVIGRVILRRTGPRDLFSRLIRCLVATVIGTVMILIGVWVKLMITPELVRLVTVLLNV